MTTPASVWKSIESSFVIKLLLPVSGTSLEVKVATLPLISTVEISEPLIHSENAVWFSNACVIISSSLLGTYPPL